MERNDDPRASDDEAFDDETDDEDLDNEFVDVDPEHSEEFADALAAVRPEIGDVIECGLFREDEYFWTYECKSVYSETDGMLSGSGSSLYHSDLGYLDSVVDTMNAARLWLEGFLAAHAK